jgi:hypothetical protein
MRKLSLSIILVLAFLFHTVRLIADSPHGKDFRISCSVCHTSESWKLDRTIYSFDHNTTKLPLEGEHKNLNCRQCHVSLVFSEAKTLCVDCHTDLHEQTLGSDCGRCHTPRSWLIENITELHQRSRFPLLGPHYTAQCIQCHPSASMLRFNPRGIECYDCHQVDYKATTQPNHVQVKFSTNCSECHSINSFTWNTSTIDHSFFPLKEGHDISDCSRCHTNGNYSNLSPECVTCHQNDYNGTTNPNHIAAALPTTCQDCHTLNPGWKPASFTIHDSKYFPIYSGNHLGTWNSCGQCHTNPASYATFSCIDCHAHNQPDMNSKHSGVGGYVYNSIACYECHPTGSTEGSFNHSNSPFPLTGAHTTVACSSCHTNGFVGTPTACSACHINSYNQTTNPNHVSAGISTTCETCHTTNPGWTPASMPTHGNYFPLTGAHISTPCNTCHNNVYNGTTPTTCAGCHMTNYNQATNPNHAVAQFPTNCESCHSTTAWSPSTFNHDGQWFPIYSGRHAGTWTTCAICHTNPANYQVFSCITCHEHNQTSMNNEHSGVTGYVYTSAACYQCHPTGGGGGLLRPRINIQKN